MGDRLEARAVDDERRPAIGRPDRRAHLAQRANDASHRPARERGIAAHDGTKIVSRQHSGHQAHRGAGISCVQWSRGRRETAQAAAVDLDELPRGLRGSPHRHAQRCEAGERRQAVRPRQVAADRGLAVRKGGEHRVTVRYGLVAGNSQRTGHSCRRLHQSRVGWRVRHLRTITLARSPIPIREPIRFRILGIRVRSQTQVDAATPFVVATSGSFGAGAAAAAC